MRATVAMGSATIDMEGSPEELADFFGRVLTGADRRDVHTISIPATPGAVGCLHDFPDPPWTGTAPPDVSALWMRAAGLRELRC